MIATTKFTNKSDILSAFLNKFKVQTQLSPIYRAMGFVGVLNYPSYFAHMPFEVQYEGTPFKTEEEVHAYRQTKIEWAFNAMKGWSTEDREWRLSFCEHNEENQTLKSQAKYDAHVIYYFSDLMEALAEYLAPHLLHQCQNVSHCL